MGGAVRTAFLGGTSVLDEIYLATCLPVFKNRVMISENIINFPLVYVASTMRLGIKIRHVISCYICTKVCDEAMNNLYDDELKMKMIKIANRSENC